MTIFGKQIPYILIGNVESMGTIRPWGDGTRRGLYLVQDRSETRRCLWVVDDRSPMSWLMAPRKSPVRRVGRIDRPSVLSIVLVPLVPVISVLGFLIPWIPAPGLISVALAGGLGVFLAWRHKWGERITRGIHRRESPFSGQVVDHSRLIDVLTDDPGLAREALALRAHSREEARISRQISEGHELLAQAEDVDRKFIEDRIDELDRDREDAESAMKDGENLIRERMRDSARSKKRGEVDRWLWR